MRRADRLKTLLPAALAFALVLGSAAAPSASYFTTYVTASGSKALVLRDTRIDIDETPSANTKDVRIDNTGETECYVRAQVFCAHMEQEGTLTFSEPGDGAGSWTRGADGYWYYSLPLPVGGSSATLHIDIDMSKFNNAAGVKDQAVDVIVVAECAPVLYDESGAPQANGPEYRGWALETTVKEG